MSLGRIALRSICDRQDRSAVRGLRDDLFSEEELPAYLFFSNYYSRYGELPTAQIMAESGFPLPAAIGATGYHLTRLRNRAVFMAISETNTDLQEAIQTGNADETVRLWTETQSEITGYRMGEDTAQITSLIADVIREGIAARTAPQGLTGITLGWPTIDELTGGVGGGDVYSVVARPNVGKSWTLVHMAKQAWLAGSSIMFVSMEMTAHQIARRTLGLATGLNPDYIRRGRIDLWGEEILHDFAERTETMPAFHLMTGSFKKSTTDIDRLVQEVEPDILFIDASYLVSPQKKQRNNGAKWERIGDVGEEVKAIASDRNIPVAQTLQLNREKKKHGENDLAQISGGDVIGQISTGVIFVDHGQGDQESTEREFELGKNREGRLGKWKANFLFNPMNFDELPPEEDDARDRLRAMA